MTWVPSPEDPNIEWTAPEPAHDDRYAWLYRATRCETSADYDRWHLQHTWHWAVTDAVIGTELIAGDEPVEARARAAAEDALAEACAAAEDRPRLPH